MNPTTQADVGKLVLRLTLGILVLLHGIAKLRGGVEGIEGMLVAHGLPGVLAYGAFVGERPDLVHLHSSIAGFYGRIGALLIVVNMLFAIGLAHMGQLGMLNDQGGWMLELQGMFLGTAIAVALIGPGRFGVNTR